MTQQTGIAIVNRTILSFISLSFILSLTSCVQLQVAGLSNLNKRDQSENFLTLGSRAYLQGNRLEAIQLFERAASADPGYIKAKLFLSHTYFIEGAKFNTNDATNNFQKSIHYAKQVLDIDPDNPDALNILSKVYSVLCQANESLFYTKKLMKVIPSSKYIFYNNPRLRVDNYFSMALSYGYLKDYASSRKYFQIYLKNSHGEFYDKNLSYHARQIMSLIDKYTQNRSRKKTTSKINVISKPTNNKMPTNLKVNKTSLPNDKKAASPPVLSDEPIYPSTKVSNTKSPSKDNQPPSSVDELDTVFAKLMVYTALRTDI